VYVWPPTEKKHIRANIYTAKIIKNKTSETPQSRATVAAISQSVQNRPQEHLHLLWSQEGRKNCTQHGRIQESPHLMLLPTNVASTASCGNSFVTFS